MQAKSTRVGDMSIRWEEHGKGFPLVLIHGIPTGPRLWRDVVPRVVGARCLAWEMVGYADSIAEGRGREISVAHQAEYLVRWLRQLEIKRAVLAGHDLGGGVAQIAAVRYPGLCAGLLLTNAIGYDSWPIPSVKALRALGSIVQHLPTVLFSAIFRSFLERGHDTHELAAAAFEVHWPLYARQGGTAAFIRQINALHVQDTLAVSDQLRHLNIPARVVWGTGDVFQKIEYGERLARDLRAPLGRLHGARHFTPEDHPDAIAEEINRLLADVQTQPDRMASR